MSFVYRCYRESKGRKTKEDNYRRSQNIETLERDGKETAFTKPRINVGPAFNGSGEGARLGEDQIEIISRVSSHLSKSSTEISENDLQPDRAVIEDDSNEDAKSRTSSSSNGLVLREPSGSRDAPVIVGLNPSNELPESSIQNIVQEADVGNDEGLSDNNSHISSENGFRNMPESEARDMLHHVEDDNIGYFYPDNRIRSDPESNSSRTSSNQILRESEAEDASPIIEHSKFIAPLVTMYNNSEGYLADSSDKDDSETSNPPFSPLMMPPKVPRSLSSSSSSGNEGGSEVHVAPLVTDSVAEVTLLQKSPELTPVSLEEPEPAYVKNNLSETIESEEYFDATSNISNDLIPHQKPSSDLDYVFHRVDGVVVRIYKDPNHPHYRPPQ